MGADAIIVFMNMIKSAIKGIMIIIIPTNMESERNLRKGSILLDNGRIAYAKIAPKIIILSMGVRTRVETTTRTKITKIADVTVSLRLSIILSLFNH
jgi:hypothetical protein